MNDKINYERNTKSTWFFLPDHEVLYIYRKFIFNDRLNDLINLDYDESKIEKKSFEIYDEIPIKINFLKLLKYFKAINNYIIYQYSIKAQTFEERKILKESKNDMMYILNRRQYVYTLPLFFISCLYFQSMTYYYFIIGIYCLNFKYDLFLKALLLANYNEFLMKYQIGLNFKLSRETREFVKYVNSNKETETFHKPKNYYEKFFVEDIYEVKFEKEDQLHQYLLNISNQDYHKKYLEDMFKKNKI
jgi:hypothetical protein